MNRLLVVGCWLLFAVTTHLKVTSTSISTAPISCGEDWIPYENEKCVKILDKLKKWEDADDECRSLNDGSDSGSPPHTLLTIKTEAEQQFFNSLLFNENDITNNVWLNLKKETSSGNFIWNDGLEVTYTNWKDETVSDTDSNCFAMNSHLGEGLWVKMNCGKKNMVVCEKVPKRTTEAPQSVDLELVHRVIKLEREMKLVLKELEKCDCGVDKLSVDTGAHGQTDSPSGHINPTDGRTEVIITPITEIKNPCSSTPAVTSKRPKHCMELKAMGCRTSGVYTIYPEKTEGSSFQVYCDMETDGGGWTVFQRRAPAKVHINFYRGWEDYQNGFGNLTGEFWLGNDLLHVLTDQDQVTLRIDMQKFDGLTSYATYGFFHVGDAGTHYILSVGDFVGATPGVPGDSLSYHNKRIFVTYDRDDIYNCAKTYKGGWWYYGCHHSGLNGRYLNGVHTSFADGINWLHWTGYHYSLMKTEMKIRPKQVIG